MLLSLKKTLFIAVGLFWLVSANTSLASGSTGYFNIVNFNQRECNSMSKGLELTLSANHANPDGCSNSLTVNINCNGNDNFDRLYSTALSAFMAGKNVNFWVNGCDLTGTSGEANVITVQIE
ncbi:hypothetical protein [Thalassolituus sp.]|jgi:hypothetical protein|uniref:hypothetical protein n=1 Tax=Thalassolituus sp. TaxID=2030822 RepID=UPI002A82245B|nr:hypothetical protein [Thalassolituus sp.]